MKENFEEITVRSLILNASGGLIAEVRPKMRAVFIEYEREKETISLYIYYNSPLTQEEKDYDIAGGILTEIISMYPQAVDLFWNQYEIILPYPSRIPEKGICVYRRYEPNSDIETNYVKGRFATSMNSYGGMQKTPISGNLTRADLILSATLALLGEVRPNMREVNIEYSKEQNKIVLYFFYDCPPSQEELDYDVFGVISAKMRDDFSNKMSWEEKVIVLPYPSRIPDKGMCIYKRYELNPDRED